MLRAETWSFGLPSREIIRSSSSRTDKRQLHLADGYGAIVISYQEMNTLYVFQSDQFPPQEPQLLLNRDEALSIEGAGKVLPLKGGSMMDAMSDLEIPVRRKPREASPEAFLTRPTLAILRGFASLRGDMLRAGSL